MTASVSTLAVVILLVTTSSCWGAGPTAERTPTVTEPSAPQQASTLPSGASVAPATSAAGPQASGATAPSSAAELARALEEALERSDYVRIAALVSSSGWNGGYYRGSGTPRMSAQETVDWLRARAKDGRLNASVEPSPILPHMDYQPLGDSYVRSVWRDFENIAQQNVNLILRNDGGRWSWSGALFRAPD
jgi:hypothetical protein